MKPDCVAAIGHSSEFYLSAKWQIVNQDVLDLILILKDPSGYCMQTGLEGVNSESEIGKRYRSLLWWE